MAGEMLRDALVHGVKELYGAERQQALVLPALLRSASSPRLRDALALHVDQTAEHVRRLECVFTLLGAPIRRVACPGVLGILEECREAAEAHGAGAVRDASIIAAAQRIDYYEMAAYGTAAAWARALGLTAAARFLDECLDEEVSAADDLLALALTDVYRAAAHAPRRFRVVAPVAPPHDPVQPHGPIPDAPRSPGHPVVPPDDPRRPDVDREPSIDPPATEPPVHAPSEEPLVEEPPRPRARARRRPARRLEDAAARAPRCAP